MNTLYLLTKKIVIWCFILIITASCSIFKEIPVNTTTETVYNYIDTLIIRDSTVLIPKYVVKDVVPEYDTLLLETNLAKSKSYIDTLTKSLKGEIQNKVETVQKIVYKDRTVYKDSIQIQEKEIPVYVTTEKKVVPSWCWWLLGINVALLLVAVIFLLKKLKIFCFN